MNKMLNSIKKHWTRVWLVSVLLLACGIFVAYAAYTEISSVKRVVSTISTPGELFSSNCMRKDISSRRLTSKEYTITVCNFDQETPTTYNPSNITYTLYAELQIKQGDDYVPLSEFVSSLPEGERERYVTKASKYFITKTEDDENGTIEPLETKGFTIESNFKVTFDVDMLASQKSSIDKYKVEVDEEDLNNTDTEFFIHVWAEPTVPANLSNIEARLYGAKTIADTGSWTGTFLETNCATVDYDFYNYVITGSGVGTVDILWDAEKFEINQFFFNITLSGNEFDGGNSPVNIETTDNKYGRDKYEGKYVGWKKVTLKVDSTSKNRYELQLYKTPSNSLTGVSYTGENAATNFIACYFNK